MTDMLRLIKEAGADIAAYLDGDASRVKVETLRVPDDVDVRAIRQQLGLTQAQFAALFGFKLATVQSWERRKKRRKPALTARILLTALQRRPDAILSALAA